ncbi:MAG: RDD family protein [Bacteriovoracaceae bacterium]|nr:RDD family protein [Bacteriovoracaceae bacterium]
MAQVNEQKSPIPTEIAMKTRVYSFVLDLLVISVIQKGIMLAFRGFLKIVFYQFALTTQKQVISGLAGVDLLSLLIVFWGYFTLSFYLAKGQTIGKMLFNLRIISKSDNVHQELNFKQSAMRSLGYLVCYLSANILFIIPFLRKDRKGIPDWFSKTWVGPSAASKKYMRIMTLPDNVILFPVQQELFVYRPPNPDKKIINE